MNTSNKLLAALDAAYDVSPIHPSVWEDPCAGDKTLNYQA
jgi:hypothetical protein